MITKKKTIMEVQKDYTLTEGYETHPLNDTLNRSTRCYLYTLLISLSTPVNERRSKDKTPKILGTLKIET